MGFKEDSAKTLLSRLRTTFKSVDNNIAGSLTSGPESTLRVACTKQVSGIYITNNLVAENISKWTSEDYMFFEKLCVKEFK